MTRRGFTRAGVALLLSVALLAAISCSSSSSDEPSSSSSTGGGTVEGSGGTLRIGITASNVPIPNTPPTEGGEGGRMVGRQIYDSLLWEETGPEGPPTLLAGLAESWTLKPDQVTWVFNLRKGVVFHDDTPFNAEAVMFQYNRISNKDFEFYDADSATQSVSALTMVKTMRQVDEYTVELETKAPYAFLLYDIMGIYFPSPTAVKKYGNKEYPKYATGTGPFVMTKYIDGQVMELKANEKYWRGRPKLDNLVLLPMPDPATRLAALQSGDINWAEIPPTDAVKQLKDSGFQVLLRPAARGMVYLLNTYKAPLNDVRVRQAISYAADRKGVATLIGDVAVPAKQYVPEGHPWYDPSWEGFSYDPAKAKQLLAAAGYANGLKLRLIYPTSGSGNLFPAPMNEKLQADLRAVGIDLEITPTEWTNIQSMRRKGFTDPEVAQYDMIYHSLPAAPPTWLNIYLTERIPPKGCCNTVGYSNPVVDELYNKAQTTFNLDEQNLLLRQLQSAMLKDAPAMVTLHDLNMRVLSKKVHGFVQPQSSSYMDLLTTWVEK